MNDTLSISGPSRYDGRYAPTPATALAGAGPGTVTSQASASRNSSVDQSKSTGPSRYPVNDTVRSGALQSASIQPNGVLGQAADEVIRVSTTTNNIPSTSNSSALSPISPDDSAGDYPDPKSPNKTKTKGKSKVDTSLVKPLQELDDFLEEFWTKQVEVVEEEDVTAGYALPLARIKKVMKSDEEVRVRIFNPPITDRTGKKLAWHATGMKADAGSDDIR